MKTKLLALVALLGILATPSCSVFSANWQDTAGKLLASSALTVDASMKGWAAWVAQGHATAPQEAQVKTAYGQYQIALTTAQAAYTAAVATKDESLWTQAGASLSASSSGVTTLIQALQTSK